MSQLMIADTVIRQDAEGRYCLNDLHKAAGGEERHATWRFLRLDTTAELIEELKTTISGGFNPVAKTVGRNGGSFVCKELVYTYAMWVSPKFHLKVVEFFDRGQTQGIAIADHAADAVLDDPLEYMERLLNQAKKLKAERDRIQAERDRFKSERDGVVQTIGVYQHTINRFVRMLPGVNSMATKGDLHRLGYLYRQTGHYRVYAKYRHLFEEKFDETTGRGNLYCTPEGKALLGHLYREGKLTMKVGHQVQQIAV